VSDPGDAAGKDPAFTPAYHLTVSTWPHADEGTVAFTRQVLGAQQVVRRELQDVEIALQVHLFRLLPTGGTTHETKGFSVGRKILFF
jgi:hypothetical protein